eukprot:g6423.t1
MTMLVDDVNDNQMEIKQSARNARLKTKVPRIKPLFVQPSSFSTNRNDTIDLTLVDDEKTSGIKNAVGPVQNQNKYNKTPSSPTLDFKSLKTKKYRQVKKDKGSLTTKVCKKGIKSTLNDQRQILEKENDQWIDKYKPNTIDSLQKGINKKKISDIENWMINAIKKHNVKNRVLLLTGPSGVGKSTVVEVLSKELNIDIRKWRDNVSDGALDFKGWERLRLFSQDHGRSNSSSMDNFNFGQPRRISQTEDLRRFLIRSKRYQALNLVQVSNNNKSNNNDKDIRLAAKATILPSIILLDYLPSPNKNNSYEALHNVMNDFLKYKKGSPLIIVYSGSNGSHPTPSELKKVFSSEFLSSNVVHEIQCRPVSKSGVKRVLKQISDNEHLTFSDSVYENIIEQSNGDLRHGIILLQYCVNADNMKLDKAKTLYHSFLNTNRNTKQINNAQVLNNGNNINRKNGIGKSKDMAYDMLHNIGKLLYAKREEETRQLKYDPDTVLSSIGMDPMLIGSFLSQNAPSFYSDIDELGELSSLLSDIECLSIHERQISFGHGQLSKSERQPISSCLVSRAVSTTNLNPAKWKFTKIVRPQMLGIEQNIKNNLALLSTTFGYTVVSDELRTDTLPHLAKIVRSNYKNHFQLNRCQESVLNQLSCYRGIHDLRYSSRIGTLNNEGLIVGRWE